VEQLVDAGFLIASDRYREEIAKLREQRNR
jgi:hypothetical protein